MSSSARPVSLWVMMCRLRAALLRYELTVVQLELVQLRPAEQFCHPGHQRHLLIHCGRSSGSCPRQEISNHSADLPRWCCLLCRKGRNHKGRKELEADDLVGCWQQEPGGFGRWCCRGRSLHPSCGSNLRDPGHPTHRPLRKEAAPMARWHVGR